MKITAINNRLPQPKDGPHLQPWLPQYVPGMAAAEPLPGLHVTTAGCRQKKKVSKDHAPNLSSFMLLACVFCTLSL